MAEAAPKFEEVLDVIGHIGVMQWILIAFSIIQETSIALSIYFLIFAESNNPTWSCDPVNRTFGVEGLNRTDQCPTEGVYCTNITYDAGFTSIVTEWNLICERYYMGKMTVSLFFLGLTMGTLVSGQLADLFGRRMVILATWALVMVTQTCLGFMPTFESYLAVRMINGLSAGSLAVVSSILPMEYVGSKWRVAVSLRMGWRIGYFITIGLAYGIRKWQHLSFACGLFCVPFFPFAWFFMPESARWSIQRGRFDEAMYWIGMIAKANRKPSPDVSLLKRIAHVEGEVAAKAKKYTYVALFRTKKYAVRTLVIMFAWMSLSLAENGLLTMTSGLTGTVYTNMAVTGTFNFFSRLTAFFVLNLTWIGRKRGFAIYFSFAVVCNFAIMILDLTGYLKDNPMVTTWLVITAFGGMSGAWSSAFIFCSELYPTLIRSLATSNANFTNRLAGVLAPQIVLLGILYPPASFVIFGSFATISIVLVMIFIPETLNKPLPEEVPSGKRQQDAEEMKTVEATDLMEKTSEERGDSC
ncbi:organic cation transporter protein-like [Lineus longissimus]|uniref:organic cation transporter protein-like n=1 Tax=Lineus longissimus TaxID=88925 RepID=UPI002B4C52E8